MMQRSWAEGRWTTAPVESREDGDDLLVTCVEHSDAWRVTSYGFTRDDAHGLVVPFPQNSSVEVVWTVDYEGEFDQAGLYIVASPEAWVKAGVEYSDGAPQLGAVVTNPVSDWSVAPVAEWHGKRVRVRASRSGDAITVRAGLDGEELRLVRLLPFPEDAEAEAGPYACAPSRAGLTVRFHSWETGEADTSLH